MENSNKNLKIKWLVDSCADVFGILEKCNCDVLPLIVNLDGKEFLDNGTDITTNDIYTTYEETKKLPKTSALNEFAYKEHFEKYANGYDAVIYFALSDGISSSYNNAVNAAKNFDNVYVINSKSLSSGIAVELLYAQDLAKQNMPIDELIKKIEANVEKTHASFVIESLEFLYKGGRCSGLAYLGANLFRIKPSLLLEDGKITSWKKFRGKQNSVVEEYVNYVLEQNPNPNKKRCFVTHSKMDDELVDIVRKKAVEAGFEEIIECDAGCTVTSHCGANTIGLLFLNN